MAKVRIDKQTLSDARREAYTTRDAAPYKLCVGRCPDGSGYKPCYYMFDTKGDYDEWLRHEKDEHQMIGPNILRHVVKNLSPECWFGGLMPTGQIAIGEAKSEITGKIMKLYGCGKETAGWVFKELAKKYDKTKVFVYE